MNISSWICLEIISYQLLIEIWKGKINKWQSFEVEGGIKMVNNNHCIRDNLKQKENDSSEYSRGLLP